MGDSAKVGSIYVDVRGDTDPLQRAMARALNTATDSARKIYKTVDKNIVGGFNRAEKAAMGVSSAVFSLKGAIVGLGSAYALQALGRQFLDAAASAERLQTSLDTITKGKGVETFNALNNLAKDLPVNTDKLIASYTNLRAMGLDPTRKDVVTLVDTMSALGGSADTLQGIARAMGQMATKGKVSMEEMLQLAERGIPAFQILETQMGLTKSQLGEIGKAGLDVNDVLKALMDGMESRYGGASEKMMLTWDGMLVSMESTMVEFQRAVMNSGPFEAMKESLKGFLDYLATNEGQMDLAGWAQDTAEAVLEAFRWMAKGVELFEQSIAAVRLTFASVMELAAKGQVAYNQAMIPKGYAGSGQKDPFIEKYVQGLVDAKVILAASTAMIKGNAQAIIDSGAAFDKTAKKIDEWKSKTKDITLFGGGSELGGAGIGAQADAAVKAVEEFSVKDLKILQAANREKYAIDIALANQVADDSWLIREEGLEKALGQAEDAQTRMTQMEYDAEQKRAKQAATAQERSIKGQERAAEKALKEQERA
ncbi:MAG: hypothetical protein DRH26_19255, partial [Deltaproteobacteria bacterium]